MPEPSVQSERNSLTESVIGLEKRYQANGLVMVLAFLSSLCLCAFVVQSIPRDSHHLFERYVAMIAAARGGK